jgi:hypothetical protein
MLRVMKYHHWASEPVRLRKMKYTQSGHPKPNGLWFDVNEEWKQWCEGVDFRLDTLRYRHTVTILDRSRMLFLRGDKDIDEFTHQYCRSLFGDIQLLQSSEEADKFARDYRSDLFAEIKQQFSNYIAWGEVAEKHSGIIVAPYSRAKSETYLWYYGWNCASGCIWDTSVIRLGKPRRMIK